MNSLLIPAAPRQRQRHGNSPQRRQPQPLPEWAQFTAVLLCVLQFCGQIATVGSGPDSQYAYQTDANGLLTKVTNAGATYTYAYGDNSLLTSRTTPWLTQTMATRDNRGRVLTENSVHSGTTELSETMAYQNNSQLSSYSASGTMSLAATTLTYGYDGRERSNAERGKKGTGMFLRWQIKADFETEKMPVPFFLLRLTREVVEAFSHSTSGSPSVMAATVPAMSGPG
jgi:YD repeat-containing protein